jgi:DNA-binding response OmpR family regulator
VARVLISEPHPDCRALLELVVTRAGHDPIGGGGGSAEGDDLAALILEPASAEGLALAQRLRRRLGDLPIICTSVRPPDEEIQTLRPAAYLLKPFRLSDLDSALADALG